MDALLRDRALLYVTGKGGVGKTTVAAALGLAAAETGRRTIVCEVAEQDRMSRAFARQGVRPRARDRARRGPLGDHDRPAAGARGVARQAARRRCRRAHPGPLARVPVLRRRRARREGADHDREGLGARAARSAGTATTAPTTSWSSTRRRPATASAMLTTPRTFGEIARVGPIRRQATKVTELLADPSATGYVAVALPEEMPVNETLELERRLRGRRRPRAGRDRRQRDLARALLAGRRHQAARRRPRRPRARGRAARCTPRCGEHERVKASARTCGACEAASEAPITALPFVFESELELAEYEQLAVALAADTN